ncbi:MAG: MerR family transcriptional regulator [bacterium]
MTKSSDAFRTISEAADELDLPQHVLRHWEDTFGNIRPMRRAGGRRYYRSYDIELLSGVKTLLYGQGYTAKGVQKIFKEHGAQHVAEIGQRALKGLPPLTAAQADAALPDLKVELPEGNEDISGKRATSLKQEITSIIERLEVLQTKLDEAILSVDSIILEQEETEG